MKLYRILDNFLQEKATMSLTEWEVEKVTNQRYIFPRNGRAKGFYWPDDVKFDAQRRRYIPKDRVDKKLTGFWTCPIKAVKAYQKQIGIKLDGAKRTLQELEYMQEQMDTMIEVLKVSHA